MITSAAAMMTNTTMSDASGWKTFVKPSNSPRPYPVSTAPRIEPRPLITTTADTPAKPRLSMA